jgi:hypothetical protein
VTRARRAAAHRATPAERMPPRRFPSFSRPSLLALTVAAISLLGSAGAFAYWTSTGSGNGTGGTATTVPLTLTPGAVSGSLFPGGSASVVLTVSNPNLSPIRIGTFLLDTTSGTSGFTPSGCSLTFTAPTTGWTVPAKSGSTNGTLSVTLPSAVAMAASAASACQGANITVYLAADYLKAS